MDGHREITEVDVDELWLREWAEEGLARLARYLALHAADLVQETFVRALPRLDRLPPERGRHVLGRRSRGGASRTFSGRPA